MEVMVSFMVFGILVIFALLAFQFDRIHDLEKRLKQKINRDEFNQQKHDINQLKVTLKDVNISISEFKQELSSLKSKLDKINSKIKDLLDAASVQ